MLKQIYPDSLAIEVQERLMDTGEAILSANKEPIPINLKPIVDTGLLLHGRPLFGSIEDYIRRMRDILEQPGHFLHVIYIVPLDEARFWIDALV